MSRLVKRIAKGLYGPNAATARTKRSLKPDNSCETATHFHTKHPTKGWRKISWARVALGLGKKK